MAGLEEVGIPGPEHLRETLTNCTDPLAAIEEFQVGLEYCGSNLLHILYCFPA